MKESDLEDQFFESFIIDYPEFKDWYIRKAKSNHLAFFYYEENKITGFVNLKFENSSSVNFWEDKIVKLSSFKITDKSSSRKNANAIFDAIHNYCQILGYEAIYATCFEKHKGLLNKMLKFKYEKIDINDRGEIILFKKLNSLNT